MQDGSEYDDLPVRVERLRLTLPRRIAKHLEPIIPELDRLGVLRSEQEIDAIAADARRAARGNEISVPVPKNENLFVSIRRPEAIPADERNEVERYLKILAERLRLEQDRCRHAFPHVGYYFDQPGMTVVHDIRPGACDRREPHFHCADCAEVFGDILNDHAAKRAWLDHYSAAHPKALRCR